MHADGGGARESTDMEESMSSLVGESDSEEDDIEDEAGEGSAHGGGASLNGVELSHDGAWLFARGFLDRSCAFERLVVWDLAQGRRVRDVKQHKEDVWHVQVGSKYFSSCSSDGELMLWDLDMLEPLVRFKADKQMHSCGVSDDGSALLAGLASGQLCILAAQTSPWEAPPLFGLTGIPRMQPDDCRSNCSVCARPFTWHVRRHHCRRCGCIICGDCSRFGAPRNELEREYAVKAIKTGGTLSMRIPAGRESQRFPGDVESPGVEDGDALENVSEEAAMAAPEAEAPQPFKGQTAALRTLGTSGSAGAGEQLLSSPRCVAVEATFTGLVYVADFGNHRVQVLTKDGVYVRTLGTTGSAGAGELQFNCPEGVAVEDGPTGLVYVADYSNHRVQVLTKDGVFVRTLGTTGSAGAGEHQFSGPCAVAVEDGNEGLVYIVDSCNHRVQMLTKAGAHVRTLGTGKAGDGDLEFDGPTDVAVDEVAGDAGFVYVADSNNQRVLVLTKAGTYVRTLGKVGVDDSHFVSPQAVAVQAGEAGLVYVADQKKHRVQVLTKAGLVVRTLGVAGSAGAGAHQFRYPVQVCALEREVFVADSANHRVQVWATVHEEGVGSSGGDSDGGDVDTSRTMKFLVSHPDTAQTTTATQAAQNRAPLARAAQAESVVGIGGQQPKKKRSWMRVKAAVLGRKTARAAAGSTAPVAAGGAGADGGGYDGGCDATSSEAGYGARKKEQLAMQMNDNTALVQLALARVRRCPFCAKF